ncbi:MAG: hypothetical protein ACHREM_01030 [Polyangiales bacterium]
MPKTTRTRAKKARGDIEDDTPILLDVIAETVAGELGCLANVTIPASYEARLVERFRVVDAGNDRFAKAVRGNGNKGRDAAYMYMRHWLASFVKRDEPLLIANVRRADFDRFANGQKVA